MASLSAKLALPRTTATATYLSSTPPDSMQRTGEHLKTSPWPGCPVDQNLLWSLPEAGQMQPVVSGLLDPALPCFCFLSSLLSPPGCRHRPVLHSHAFSPADPSMPRSSWPIRLSVSTSDVAFLSSFPHPPAEGLRREAPTPCPFPLPRFHSYLTGRYCLGLQLPPPLLCKYNVFISSLQIQCVYFMYMCAQVGSRIARSIVWSWVCVCIVCAG